ncbi:TKL protein kinase [Phytophthora palmivora]|uniref:2'-phosphotransferase n=1 Tax=Phytophthora palmivora TaxID=4796 RepID=A0A2P4Y594_9STRA|nr:TKL protein kinase [Phytophthora palmivora]
MDTNDSSNTPCWENIPFRELTVCETIGGGGVALVHRGIYRKHSVALKSLVRVITLYVMKCVKYAYYAVFINVKFDPRVDEALKQEFMDELLVMRASKLVYGDGALRLLFASFTSWYQYVLESTTIDTHGRTSIEVIRLQNCSYFAKHTSQGDIANGMRFLHSRKPAVIHRDLKSANVLLDPKGVAKLCDFGLVRTKFTSAGTPCYMPPELLSGHPFSKSVDVYMFGILLWEIFSRDIPFRGYDISDIKRRVLAGERFRVPTVDCPRECQELMKRCWDGEPNNRPTFDEVHEALQHVSFATSFEASQNAMHSTAYSTQNHHRKPRRGKTRPCGRKEDPPEVRLSKTLAYALRHGAEELQLDMRPSGFVPLDQLLALPLFQSFTEQQVEEVVRTNAKKRFSMTTDETGTTKFIRANQGHTLQLVQDEELLTPLEDPHAIDKCVHGTYLQFWESIYNTGLSKMQRNHIHFAEREVMDDEVVSGMRSNCNLLLYIDFPMAMQDGIKFYKSSNNVVLSPGMGDSGVIDRRYFLRAMKRDGTVVYDRDE